MTDWTESDWFETWLSLARHTGASELWEEEAANFSEPARVLELKTSTEGE